MKKILSLFMAISFIAFIVISCNKDKGSGADESGSAVKVDKGPKTRLGNYLPDDVTIQGNNRATVRLLPSAAQYTLDVSSAESKKYELILKDGIQKGIPVEVYVYENTTEIAEVKVATKEIVTAFNKQKGEPALTTKENLPIIPNQAALNSLFTSCATPSISYNYAGDGCYARAHKMRQIILNAGYDCAKQFIYGSLAAQSVSGCCANWSYHVAPLVRFRDANGQIQLRVIDPSLFNQPVTQAQWFAACLKTTCSSAVSQSGTKLTAGNVYYTTQNGSTTIYDDNYTATNCVISHFLNYFGCFGAPNPPC